MDEQFDVLPGHTKATTTGKSDVLPQGILSHCQLRFGDKVVQFGKMEM
jgi:hypothetical protein